MAYNILKTMWDSSGRKKHILLNNGLSEILSYDDVHEAMRMVTLLNNNSDTRTAYEIRPTRSVAKGYKRNSTTSTNAYPNDVTWTNGKDADTNNIQASGEAVYGTDMDADETNIRRMLDLLRGVDPEDQDPPD